VLQYSPSHAPGTSGTTISPAYSPTDDVAGMMDVDDDDSGMFVCCCCLFIVVYR
jgi:hypothetical protein